MWEKITADVKCPRGDCAFFKTADNDQPCGSCSCNLRGKPGFSEFRYKPTGIPEIEVVKKTEGK